MAVSCTATSTTARFQAPSVILDSAKLSATGSSFWAPVRVAAVPTRRLCASSRRQITPQVAAKKEAFSSFDDLLEKSDKPVLVDFYATWCGPCQFMVPILEEVGNTLKDKIQVVKIDTEKYPSIANRYKIEALPTFIIFKDGKPCDRFEGALPANQLIDKIGSALK